MQVANAPNNTPKKRKLRDIAPASVTMPFHRACQIYGLSYKAMRAAVYRGELAILKISRSWYVRRADLEKFLDAHGERFDPKLQEWRSR